MIQVRLNGTWLRSIGAWSEMTVTQEWPHGLDSVTWKMKPETRHPKLNGGTLCEVFDNGHRLGPARMTESVGNDGEFAAKGLWSQAQGVYALDGSGNATNTPDTAIDAAISRGAVTWTRPASLSAVAWGTASEPMLLTELLDKAIGGLGKRWYIDADGAVRAANDPTTPNYVVPHAVAGRGLTLAEDTYFSHIVGTYSSSTVPGTFPTVTVGDAAAATRWGRREALCDLTPMGPITAATATTELTNRLALSGARMGYAESLDLGRGQLTTSGGTAVPLTFPTAGQMVRLMGVTDRTRATGESPVTDVVIARSTYTDGAATVRLDPMGKADRDLSELLRVA